jgi:hypothetical protein
MDLRRSVRSQLSRLREKWARYIPRPTVSTRAHPAALAGR